MFYFVVAIGAILTVSSVYTYRERALYILFLLSYTQNFLISFLYTHSYIGRDAARGLLLFKDLLLLELFAWCAFRLATHFRRPWPRPLRPLVILTGYCIFRFVVAIYLGDDWVQGVSRVRNICFPFEIIVVVVVLAAINPEFGRQFLVNMAYILSALAVVALAIVLWAPRDFWVSQANIAELQADVKGDTENEMNFEEGLSLAGTMQGREVLTFLSSFRAIGTFGEALALSFSMTVPVILFSTYLQKSVTSILAFSVSVVALFFALTRSAWMFSVFVILYTLIRKKRYRFLSLVGISTLSFVLFWTPMREFAAVTFSRLSPAADNPDSLHAEGLLYFYSQGLTDTRNILGKGMNAEAQEIPESGYAYLLEHFGLIAYASFVWFCFSLHRQLRPMTPKRDDLDVLGQGIALGIILIMHFSQYPFSLPCFLSLWYIVGVSLSKYLAPRTEARLVRQRYSIISPKFA